MLRPLKSQVRQIGEFAQIYRWGIQFAKEPTAVSVPPNFNLQCISTGVPKTEAGELIELNIRGHKIKRPGQYHPNQSITVTFAETIDNQISEFLRTWREMVSETDTAVQQMTPDLQADIIMTRLDNLDNPIWQYTLLGAYLEDYDPQGGDLSADSDSLKPTLTLYFDDFRDKAL